MPRELTPLQQRLKSHALRRVRSERAERLAPVFAAFAENTDQFRYMLDPQLDRSLSRSVGALMVRYSSCRLITIERSEDVTFETMYRALTRLITQNSLSGDADFWIGDTVNHAAHVDFEELGLGYFSACLPDTIRAVARILSSEQFRLCSDMALVGADRRWMIHIEDGGRTLTLTASR